MKLSHRVKPISYLKSNAAQVVRDLAKQKQPLIITQNGEAKLVVQDIESFERTEETLALLKILTLGNRQIEKGQTCSIDEAVDRVRNKRNVR